jgi:hypothetical protein
MDKTGAGKFAFILATVAIVLGAATSARAQAGPVGYWKGDDGGPPPTGNIAADSSGFGSNGTYQSGATTSASVPTLQFTNATSMSFTVAGATVSAPTFSWPTGGPVTVAFWNNVTTAQVRNSSAFTVGNMDTPNRFHVHAPWSDSNIYWDYGDLGGTGRISTNYTAYLNKWTHVALVSTGNGGNFKAIYLDGVLIVSAASSDGPDVAMTGVNIGRWPANGLDHQGLIDDFRIYDRVLSAAQIAQLAAGLSEPPAPAGLTAVPGAMGQILLAWTAAQFATSYTLLRGTTPGGPYPTVIPVAGTAYTDTGLANGTTYYYVVSGIGSVGVGPNSAEASATTLTPPPPPPRTAKGGNDTGRCGCGSVPPGGIGAWGWTLLALSTALAFGLRR